MKICLITLATPEIRRYSDLSGTALNKYSEKHGYHIDKGNKSLNPSRHLMWTKILMLLRNISKYDYLFWIDADSIILNHEIKLESIIEQHKDRDFIFTMDCNGINAGLFFVKCSKYAKEILDKVYSMKEFDNHKWFEQAAFSHLYYSLEGLAVKTGIARKRDFNSYLMDYEPGDFILHLPGMTNLDRENIFRSLI